MTVARPPIHAVPPRRVRRIGRLLLAATLASGAAHPLAAQQATTTGADTTPRADPGTSPDSAAPRGRWGFGPTQLKLILHVDYARGTDARAQLPGPGEGFALRRARVILQGAAPLGLGYGLHVDVSNLAGGSEGVPPFRGAPLVEAYLDYRLPGDALVRVGQQRVLFGLNSTTAAPTLPTPEFAQFARSVQQRVSAFRDVGATVQGRLGRVEYAGGVFNGGGINVLADNDSTVDVATRLSYAVLPGLTVGASGWIGHAPKPYVRPGQTRPAAAFYDDADFRRYGIDARWSRGPLLVTGEYARNHTDHEPAAITPTPGGRALDQTGWNIMAAVRLAALHRSLRPVELVGRYDVWDPNGAVAEDEITEIVAGLNVHLAEVNAPPNRELGRALNFVQRSSKLMLFVEHSRFGRAGTEGVGGNGMGGTGLSSSNTRFHARWALFY